MAQLLTAIDNLSPSTISAWTPDVIFNIVPIGTAWERMVRVQPVASSQERDGYNAVGDLTTTTDPLGQVTTYA